MDKNDLKPLIRAMTYLKKYVWYIIFGFICTACVNLFTLSQPLLIKKVMDDVVFAGKATGHKVVVDPKVPATATKSGLTAGSHCSVCHKVIKPQTVIPATGSKQVSAEKVKNSQLKKNLVVADKKTGGKYRITKVTKKGNKVTGGTVEYVAPYNKDCKLASATGKVKLGGAIFKVTSIGKNAFAGCTKLNKVVIGPYVTQIGANAFKGCSSLKSVTIKSASIKKIGSNAFKGINSKAKVKVPGKKLAAYKKLIKKANAPKTVKVQK